MNIKYRTLKAAFVLSLAILLPISCTEDEKQESINIPVARTIQGSPFVIALLPGRNVFQQKEQYNALAVYLSKSTGMNIKTKLLDSYASIYSEIKEGKVNAAVLGGLSYVVINSKIPLEPIARPYLKDGTSTYNSVIFTTRNSGINEDVTTWKDKRIVLVNKSSYSGYVFPLWYLNKNGVKDLVRYFRSVNYTGSADSSITAVFQGQADIGCSSKRRFNELIEKDPQMRRKLTIIANSPSLPYNTFVMKRNENNILKVKMKAALLDMDKTPEGREALSAMKATHFIETKGSEYSLLSGMLDNLGLKTDDFNLEFIEILHLPPEN
jgi:phosphonate transport system substrate-binding protein